MITRSLAAGKINNVQANDYYGLLAGIEADEAELAHSTGIARSRAVENLKGRLSALQKTLEQKIGKSPGAINTSALCETLLNDLKADLASSKLNQLEAYLMRKEVDRLTAKKQQIDAIMKDTKSTEESSLQGLATELNTLKVQVNKELSRRPSTLSAKRVR
ncbi:MAG: hypothetical protein HYX67_12055 [Candidatus Melainabacteria bacterium]|nr:hypothetical protein [Candidatus Melainabacteria bacterium]